MIAIFFFIAGVLTLTYLIYNLNTPTTDSVSTIPPAPFPATPPP